MAWVALVGPEIEENLSLRYIAASLAASGFRSEIVPFNSEADFGSALEAILRPVLAPGAEIHAGPVALDDVPRVVGGSGFAKNVEVPCDVKAERRDRRYDDAGFGPRTTSAVPFRMRITNFG